MTKDNVHDNAENFGAIIMNLSERLLKLERKNTQKCFRETSTFPLLNMSIYNFQGLLEVVFWTMTNWKQLERNSKECKMNG